MNEETTAKITDELRKCTQCGVELPLEYFVVDKRRKDGRGSWCKDCGNRRKREYYLKNKTLIKGQRSKQLDRIKKYRKAYYARNSSRLLENDRKRYEKNKKTICSKKREKYHNDVGYREKILEKCRDYQLRNPEVGRRANRKYKKKKHETDPTYRLNSNVSRYIHKALVSKRPNAHWENFMPFTLIELIKHLEKQFKPGMNWDNYGKGGWELDHIVPLSWFNYKCVQDAEFLSAWNLSNLQPLWCFENQSKSNKYVG